MNHYSEYACCVISYPERQAKSWHEAKKAAVQAFSRRIVLAQELNQLADEIMEREEQVEIIKKLRKLRPYRRRNELE